MNRNVIFILAASFLVAMFMSSCASQGPSCPAYGGGGSIKKSNFSAKSIDKRRSGNGSRLY